MVLEVTTIHDHASVASRDLRRSLMAQAMVDALVMAIS